MEPNEAQLELNQSPLQQQQQSLEIADQFDRKLTLLECPSSSDDDDDDEDEVQHQDDDVSDDEDCEGGEFEFSFAGGGDLSSPVSAEEVFKNGQIRPIFPFSDDTAGTSDGPPPVKKVFVVSDDVAEGPYCTWTSERSSSEKTPSSSVPAPEMSRKSNSTGFSKLWRVKELLVRSNSDGKDAFVFLNGKDSSSASKAGSKIEEKAKRKVNLGRIKVGKSEAETSAPVEVKVEKRKKKGKKQEVSASTAAYEALYGKKEKKKGGGKSYLPYRQDLVGFFTNVNGMTRNVHPY